MRAGAAEVRFGRNVEDDDFGNPEGDGLGGQPRGAGAFAVVVAHQIAEAIMTVSGSLFWVMLAIGWVCAVLGPASV
jgi:hypothetical protein